MAADTFARCAASLALCAAALLSVSGCGVVAMSLVSGTAAAPHTVQLSGSTFPATLFVEAAVKAGGVVTVHTNEYMRAELRAALVTIEMQQLRAGEYQLVGSAHTSGALRLPSFGNKVEEATRKVADHLVGGGYRVMAGATPKNL